MSFSNAEPHHGHRYLGFLRQLAAVAAVIPLASCATKVTADASPSMASSDAATRDVRGVEDVPTMVFSLDAVPLPVDGGCDATHVYVAQSPPDAGGPCFAELLPHRGEACIQPGFDCRTASASESIWCPAAQACAVWTFQVGGTGGPLAPVELNEDSVLAVG